ncbi:MAG TPA: efflux RND transporter periplasmic adaptor subunit, partial [Kofleriaceae bacterium]|nr:efflux RND transporter periplasmic adaptor subunit [Kofleriaceae bacterium]
MRSRTLIFIVLCAAGGVAVGCKGSPAADGPPQGGGAPRAAEVGVVTLKTEAVTLQTELAGRTTASLASDLRPQVTGILKARTFEEGAHVKAGQVMYEIDPAMYRAAYAEAQADVASAKASLDAAKLKAERFAELVKIEGVSKQEAEDARAAFELATAGVAQKQAALEVARINLDYTAIKAPITGRVGKSSVTPGALVTADQPTPLATIRALDPIYVDLTESSEARLKLRAQLGAGKLQAGSTKVKLKLGDGSLYGKDGTLEFSEVAVDEATGTVTLRATFPNPDDTLLPGMYVRAVLDQAVDTTAILAPQQGITRDPKGNATALVVGAGDKVEVRTLVADRAIGDRWLVTGGLNEGDKLIVEGLNKIGPGMPVHATEIVQHPAGDATAAMESAPAMAPPAPAAMDKPAAPAGSTGKPPAPPSAGKPSAPSAG